MNNNRYNSELEWDNAMINPPLISVIITTYNRKELLLDAIQSVLNQTYTNYEIIVVNDCGEDVWDMIQLFNSEKILYLSSIKNSGPAFARNTANNIAKGEYICYLDDDDMYLSNHLEEIVNMFTSKLSINILYTDADYINETIKGSERKIISKGTKYINNEFSYERLLVRNYIPINSIAHRKSILGKSGVFDEKTRTHEDWESLLRLAGKFKFYHLNKITVEVRNRIYKQDNLLAEGENRQYNIYKSFYSQYPTKKLMVREKRIIILYHFAKNERKLGKFLLDLFKAPIDAVLFLKIFILYIKRKYV